MVVFLLYRTVKQLEATVHLSKIQIDYRFRPWIGPLNSIKALPPKGDTNQYDCTIKNYGEIPAQYVKAYCKIDTKIMDRDVFKSNPGKTFNLGPLLPNMEKHYWVFIDSSLIRINGTLVYAGTLVDSAFASSSVLVDKIEQNEGWGVIAVDPQTNKVYVTNFKSTTVTVIDGTTNTPLSVINVGRTPYGLGINTDTKLLYVALEYNDTLVIVNTTTNEIIKNIDIVKPYDIAVNSKTNKV